MKEKIVCCDKRKHEEYREKIRLPDENSLDSVSRLFSLLGDNARLKIIFCLLSGEKCVCDIQAATGAMQSATSHHLRLLKDNKIIKSRREGKSIFYSCKDEHISTILEIAYTHIKEPQE